MTRRTSRFVRLAVFGVSFAALGCGAGESASIVATLGGEPVRFEDFATFVRAVAGEEWTGVEERVLTELFDQYVEECLLQRLARDEGLISAAEPAAVAAQRLVAAAGRDQVSEAEIRSYLAAEGEGLLRPARLVLGQLLIQPRELAEEAARQIAAGDDFERVARSLAATHEGVVFGGYQKDVAAEDIPLAFRERLFAMEPGEVSEVMVADYGYHLFHVREKRPAEFLDWTEVAGEAEQVLRERRAQGVLRDMLERARARYPVEILEEALPFLLQGDDDATL